VKFISPCSSLDLSKTLEGALVLNAITTPYIAPDTPRSPDLLSPASAAEISVEPISPTVPSSGDAKPPVHALDALAAIFKNAGSPISYPVEIRMNICSLFTQLNKYGGEHPQLRMVKETIHPIALENVGSDDASLEKSVKKLLDTWS
jgi:hypothetical protein